MTAIDVVFTPEQRSGLVQQGGRNGGQIFRQAVNFLVQVRFHQVKDTAFSELVGLRGYTLNVVIEDFSGDQNLLMAPVLLWLRDNQPDAINNPALREKLFTFEVDILRNDVCDISLNLQLTERVLVSTDGSVSSVEAVAEPDEPEEMWTVKRG